MSVSNNKYFVNIKTLPKGRQKRKNARLDVNITGRYVIDGGTEAYSCDITSVSTGGLAITAPVAFFKGDKLKVNFILNGYPITAEGEVTRMRGKEIGIKFVNIDKNAVNVITEYIHNKLFKKHKVI